MNDKTTITLSTGQVAEIKPGKGRDLLAAARAATDNEEIQFALIAQLTQVDGRQLGIDDVLDMPLADIEALQGAVKGKAPTPSSTTSSS